MIYNGLIRQSISQKLRITVKNTQIFCMEKVLYSKIQKFVLWKIDNTLKK